MEADQQSGTQADPVREQQDQCHERIACTHSGQRFLSDIPPDDHAVDRVVGELQQIAQDQGDCEVYQLGQDGTFCQIFCHVLHFLF